MILIMPPVFLAPGPYLIILVALVQQVEMEIIPSSDEFFWKYLPAGVLIIFVFFSDWE